MHFQIIGGNFLEAKQGSYVSVFRPMRISWDRPMNGITQNNSKLHARELLRNQFRNRWQRFVKFDLIRFIVPVGNAVIEIGCWGFANKLVRVRSVKMAVVPVITFSIKFRRAEIVDLFMRREWSARVLIEHSPQPGCRRLLRADNSKPWCIPLRRWHYWPNLSKSISCSVIRESLFPNTQHQLVGFAGGGSWRGNFAQTGWQIDQNGGIRRLTTSKYWRHVTANQRGDRLCDLRPNIKPRMYHWQ